MRTHRSILILACVLGGALAPLHAQTFFTPTPVYITPASRGSANTEYSWWDVLYSPHTYGNYPDMAAPSGPSTEGYASDFGFTPPPNSTPGNPYAFWSTSNPTLKQTGTTTAFIIGAGTSGNIYSPEGLTAFEIADTTAYDLGSVNLQWQTQGNLMDFSSLLLVYFDGFSNVELPATNFISEYKSSSYHGGAFAPFNRISAQWDLSGLGVKSYTLKFQPQGTSCSLQEVMLDTAATYSDITPSTRNWEAMGANTNWATTANWSGGLLPVSAGNVVFGSGTGAVVNGGTRVVSELTLNAPGGFTIEATGGGSLQLNSGITATPDSPASYLISAPITLGSFNLVGLNQNTDLTISGDIGGTTGFYRHGEGVLKLTGKMTFSGGLLISGGTTIVSGANTYSGGTSVQTGVLLLQGDAAAAAGTLGSGGLQVELGADGTLYGGMPEAAVLIDGPYTVAKTFYANAGNSPKKLGAQNTGAGGATFSGAISLNSAASNLRLHAESAGDLTIFTGEISGGGGSGTINKTGAGRVVLSGSNKTYLNQTVVNAGTLEIAANTRITGNGAVTVASGARLLIHGEISGSAALTLTGGTIGGSGSTTRAFTLDNGDTLAPGTSVGAFATGSEAWGNGGRFQLELADADSLPGIGWDVVNIIDALDLLASAGGFVLELRTLAGGNAGPMQDFNPAQNYSWKFATTTGGVTNFAPGDFTIDASGFQNALGGGTFQVALSGKDLLLNFQAVPEPSSALLLGGSILLLARRRRAASKPLA